MCKKLMFLISLVLVLGLGTVASADDYDWTNDYPWSYLYISPWNWDPVTPSYGGPGLGDYAYIGTAEPIVLDTDIEVGNIRGPAYDASDTEVDQTMYLLNDCNLFVDDDWRIEETGDNVGYIEMSDDAIASVGSFRCHGDDGRVVINMVDNAQLICRNDLRFGDDGSDYFELNMTDNAYLFVEDDDDRMRQNEGDFIIDVSGDAIMEVARIRARARSDDATCTFTVRENAQVICFDDYFRFGGGSSHVVIDVLDNAVVDVDGHLIFGEDDSFDGSVTLNMSGQLITMGGDIKLFDDEVDDPAYIEINLTSGVISAEELDERHDEKHEWVINICGDGVMVLDGDVVDEILEHADEGRIVACPQEDCWGEISPRGNIHADYNTPEYPGRTKVYAEETLGPAWGPNPPDGATDLPTTVELCWCPGDSECPEPLTFHVFLSTDREEVEEGDLHAWQGAQTESCFTTDPLCLGETYYWRVDSVWQCCAFDGPVWSFTVVDHVCIEDMEAYSDASNPIWDTWLDGCGDANGVGGNGTGSCVYTDTAIVHSGDKSMLYYYDCSGEDMAGDERDANYAIATRAFAGLDISSSCADAIELWFYGDPGNDATALEEMFMVIEDGVGSDAQATYGDTAPEALADMQVAEWQQWDIALASFGGVDLTDVAAISLGFGDRTNQDEQKGGYGAMRFDDICIFACRCVPKYTPDIVDLNDDCVTDWLDIRIIAGDWLEDRRCNVP